MQALVENFITVFQAVAQIGLAIVIAGWLVRRDIIPASGVKLLSDAVITVFLPCLIFSNIVGKFQPSEFTGWWALPLASASLIAVGWLIAQFLFARTGKARREITPIGFLQNAGYLILPLGQLILPESDFDQFALYVFLFILANNPLLWLIGKHYLRRRADGERCQWKQLLSPPIYANIIALFLVATGLRAHLPSVVLDTASFLGDGAVPLATFALGATLGTLKLNFRHHLKTGSLVILQKLFILPALMLGAISFIPWVQANSVLALLLVLEAASAPATSLILQSKSYSDDSERVGSIVVMCYFVCLFSIPFWVAIAQAVFP